MKKIFIILLLLSSILFAQNKNYLAIRSTPISSTLNNGLVAFWNLDETSGTRYAAVGSINLADNNTVLYGAGKIGNAAEFELDNGEYLSATSGLSAIEFTDQSFTIAAWVKQETYSAYGQIVYKGNGITAAGYEYSLRANNNDRTFANMSDGTNVAAVSPSTSYSTSLWVMHIMWYNSDTDSIYVRTKDTSGGLTAARESAVYGVWDNDLPLYIGARIGSALYMDGLVDLIGIWNRCPQGPTYAMVDSIYNSGNGWRP